MSEGGTKAGSMIFELDLDRTRYDKGLQDALTSAEEKGVSIDKAWKNLGTKSDEMFTRMKANAILSYETIAKSATASAEDQARAAAMGAAKIEALNAKQFATQIAQTKAMQAAQQQYWDNLGIRSQATIQRQIDETTKGAAILQSTLKKNSQDWINIERAKNDSLAHLHDEMVGKQEWSMAAMARAALRVYAAYYVLTTGVQKVLEYMELGAKKQQTESSFHLIAEESGAASATMIANMKAYTKETIDDSDLMIKATKLMLAGYDPKQIVEFSKVVIAGSIYMGTSVSEAYERISDSIATRMPKAMVQSGAVTKEQMLIVAQAIKNGATQADLMALVIANLRVKTLQLQGTQNESTIALQRFRAQIQELKEIVGETLIIAFQKLFGLFQGIGVVSLLATAGISKFLQKKDELNAFLSFGEASKYWANLAKEYKASAESDMEAARILAEKSIANIDGVVNAEKRASKSSIEIEKEKRDAEVARLAAMNDAAKDAGAIYAELTSANKKMYEDQVAQVDHASKMLEIAGYNEFSVMNDNINSKQKALNAWYSHQGDLINANGKTYAVRVAEMKALDADYNKQWEKYANMREESNARELAQMSAKAAAYLKDIPGMESAYAQQQLDAIEIRRQAEINYYKDKLGLIKATKAADINAAIATNKTWADQYTQRLSQAQDVFSTIGSGLEAVANTYAQGSEQQKKYHQMAMEFAVAEKAAALAIAVVKAVEACANAGTSGDGYTAVVRIAAVAGALMSLFAANNMAFNGNVSSATTAAVLPESTLLGAANGTGSESIANSLKMLESIYNVEEVKLTKIYNELVSLNNNITGLVTSLIRTGGISNAYNFGATEWESNQLELFKGLMLGAANVFITILQGSFGMLYTPWIGGQDKLAQNIANFMGDVFGGKTTQSLVASGVMFGGTSNRSLQAGGSVGSQQYGTVLVHTDGGWFSKDSNWTYDIYQSLNGEVSNMFDKVFKNMGATLIELAKGLGTDLDATLNYVFETTKINLQGKTTDEINKALTDYFNAAGDKAVEALFGTVIKGYQKLNEGLMETAVRLVTDKETILHYLKMVNQSFNGTIPEAIKFSESLIAIAGGLDKLTESMQKYYNAFFSDAEKQSKLKSSLLDMLGMYGFDLPGTRAGYRGLVESLNLTTDAGLAAYNALMQMSDSADQYYKYLETARGNIKPENYATYADYIRALHVPAFAEGGDFAGGYRIVGENGPEMEFTGPSKIFSNKDSKSLLNTEELISEVRSLRNEINKGNVSIASYTQKTAKLLDRWEVAGMPTDRGY